jgi:hypothetical protein
MTRRLRRAWRLVFFGFLACACDEMPEHPATTAPRASASAAPPDLRSLEVAAHVYLEAARAHAKTCVCFSDPFEGLIRDYCDGSGPELEALKKAAIPITEVETESPDLPPAATAFLREAALHARWLIAYENKVERWSKTETTPDDSQRNLSKPNRPGTIRGAVSAFQTLARRYNEWHPEKKVSAIAYGSYRPGGVKNQSFTLERAIIGFFSMSKVEYEKKERELEYLPWIECFDGPCIQGY